MMFPRQLQRFLIPATLIAVGVMGAGCQSIPVHDPVDPEVINYISEETPRELSKSFLPAYIIEPPDILTIEAVSMTPRSPYHIRTSDILAIQVPGAFADSPISGSFPVQPGGIIDLGPPYGTVNVGGKTVEEAKAEITTQLAKQLREPQVVVSLGEIASLQQVQGEHLVKPDGTVRLGTYGSVLVIGMTLDQAEATIEQHLAQFLDNPDVSLDVFAFNSKSYYLILQGAGLGDQLVKYPFTGNETVLDALTQLGGLNATSSNRIWVARPGPNYVGGYKLLPVNYQAITRLGDVATNYQLMPGDRLYVEQDQLIALDTALGKIAAPIERVMGFSLLGVNTVSRFSGKVLKGGGSGQLGNNNFVR